MNELPKFDFELNGVVYKDCYFYTTQYQNGNHAIFIKSKDETAPEPLMIVTKDYGLPKSKYVVFVNDESDPNAEELLRRMGLISGVHITFPNSDCTMGFAITMKGFEYFGIPFNG